MKNTRCKVTFQKYVQKHMDAKGLTKAQVARNSRGLVSESALGKLINSEQPNPTATTIRGIAEGLGVQPEELALVAMGLPIDPQAVYNSEEWQMAQKIMRLSRRRKFDIETIINIYRAEKLHGKGIEDNSDNGGK